VITDANGVVLRVEVTAANVPDQNMLLPMLKDLPNVPTVKSRMKLKEIMGDRAYGTRAVIAGVGRWGSRRCSPSTKASFQAFHDLASSLLVVNRIRSHSD